MKQWLLKYKKILAAVSGLLFILFCFYLYSFTFDFSGSQAPAWGVTFSVKYAKELDLDWQEAYLAILDDLKASHIRLIAYWDEIERRRGIYNFTGLDWQISQAASRGVNIILTVGRRTPRWPECHDPVWLANLMPETINQSQFALVKTLIERYKDQPAIKAWQVENEPLLSVFGQCPKPDKNLLAEEIKLVKSLDQRPIITTDSGELSGWQKAANYPDILGTTMYRIVWNKYFGFLDYFFVPPAFYHFKAGLTGYFHPNLKKVIVTELQMEPWTMNRPMVFLTLAEQEQSFNLKRFRDNIGFVKKTGLPEVYLWGAEYWYWLLEQGRPEIWDEARKLWAD
ncbi:MAG: hypothetical protein A3J65_01855 [Candidatus Buchananbacteria bacterium RIFCSPHIGHO2_02_FULL_45_11b]|uniref:Uncharacterized protein n=2 Tax=Candidatus Buchananiibacteriota TaxID=1817903 RepID=A0A1G1YJL5_9BACT|nr:MAG: hypothetical protein A3J65_01855 [Candidatus Buchananbacteria bacterium RIFCSPHIGHO2_02_FULL_45_11b]OGY56337.1 MAG: hypothetical protein A3H67_02150 [Candidatus Buchananbacteria bacterium RIFCSPLOWO2_02_FULL_46_11b]